MGISGGLKQKQRQALALLLAGQGITATAKALKVNPCTVHRWKGEPAFRAVLEAEADALASEARARLKGIAGRAVDVLSAMLAAGTPAALRLRAAVSVLGTVGQDRRDDLTKQAADRYARAQLAAFVELFHKVVCVKLTPEEKGRVAEALERFEHEAEEDDPQRA